MADILNLVGVSDLHAGCRLAIYPVGERIKLDDGGYYVPSPFQRKLWKLWRIFWDEFVPEATKGEPYATCVNGDAREGVHHGATTPISHNEEDQEEIAYRLIAPLVDKSKGGVYIIRGTEAHVGKSGIAEERLAKRLGVKPNAEGQHARYELWKRLGPKLVHALHHVGTVNSQAYESTALHKELVEAYIEAARWRRDPPDVIFRSHRHRCLETSMPVGRGTEHAFGKDTTGTAYAIASPAWQGKTPYAWRAAGARNTTAQFGGIVIRYAKGELFIRKCVWTAERSAEE